MVAAISSEWTCGIWPSREAYGLSCHVWVKTSVRDPFIPPSSPDSISFHYQSLFYSGLDLISRKQEERSSRENRAFRRVSAVIFVVHPLQSQAFFSFSVLIIFLSQDFLHPSLLPLSPPLPLGFWSLSWHTSSTDDKLRGGNHSGKWMRATEGELSK